MGDIESFLRMKYDFEQDDEQLNDGNELSHGGILHIYHLRDPVLDDHQNMLLHRPYSGNPFIAPGTIGSKARRSAGSSG